MDSDEDDRNQFAKQGGDAIELGEGFDSEEDVEDEEEEEEEDDMPQH